jgi:hypothetical protein
MYGDFPTQILNKKLRKFDAAVSVHFVATPVIDLIVIIIIAPTTRRPPPAARRPPPAASRPCHHCR